MVLLVYFCNPKYCKIESLYCCSVIMQYRIIQLTFYGRSGFYCYLLRHFFFFWTLAVQSIVKLKAFILLLRRHYFLTLFDIFWLCELVLEVLKAVQVSPSNSVPDTFASFLDHFWSFGLVTRCRTQLEDRRKLSSFEMVHSFYQSGQFFMFSLSLSTLTWVKIFLKVYLWYLLSAGVLCNM